MRNKAVGQARAPPARPTGGLRAGSAAAAQGRPAGPMPVGGRVGEGTGTSSSPCFGDRPCPSPQVGQHHPPEASGGKARGVPRHVPPRGGVRGRRPSEEVGRPRAAPETSGAAVVSKMR